MSRSMNFDQAVEITLLANILNVTTSDIGVLIGLVYIIWLPPTVAWT